MTPSRVIAAIALASRLAMLVVGVALFSIGLAFAPRQSVELTGGVRTVLDTSDAERLAVLLSEQEPNATVTTDGALVQVDVPSWMTLSLEPAALSMHPVADEISVPIRPVTEPIVDGQSVLSARHSIDSNGLPFVQVQLDTAATEVLRKWTTNHTGEKLAILVNGDVMMAPVVREPLTEGRIQISGMDETEAQRIASSLRAGRLPAFTVTSEKVLPATFPGTSFVFPTATGGAVIGLGAILASLMFPVRLLRALGVGLLLPTGSLGFLALSGIPLSPTAIVCILALSGLGGLLTVSAGRPSPDTPIGAVVALTVGMGLFVLLAVVWVLTASPLVSVLSPSALTLCLLVPFAVIGGARTRDPEPPERSE